MTRFMLVLLLSVPTFSLAQDATRKGASKLGTTVESVDDGTQLKRQGKTIFASPTEEVGVTALIVPRFFASLRSATYTPDSTVMITVTPEPDHWVIVRADKAAIEGRVKLQFDSIPRLESETKPIRQLGDGTVTMNANAAIVSGELLRFEPQPHKNTVGYWTKPNDFATWTIKVNQTGSFNVGVLQGCGKDQGGSQAVIRLEQGGKTEASLDFEVLETGHFQNFVWRHLGTIQIDEPGEYQVVVAAKKIQKAALMDVRQLHLSPHRP